MTRLMLYQLPHYRDLLSFFLASNTDFKVVESLSTLEIEKQIHLNQPDVVLLDIAVTNGQAIFATIRKVFPSVKVIILTNVDTFGDVVQCLRNGADGYLIINKTPLPNLHYLIANVMDGGVAISPNVLAALMKEWHSSVSPRHDLERLTIRETQILKLFVSGMSYKEVSASLCISVDTVRSHIKSLYYKLNVNSKAEAVVKALKSSIIMAHA